MYYQGYNVSYHEEVQPIGRNYIRFFLTKDGASITIHVSNQRSSPLEDQVMMGKVDKMKMIRGKMMMSRKKRENQETRNAILIRKRKEGNLPQFINGEKVVYAMDVHNSEVQEDVEVVINGADVEALNPSLSDLEVAMICYDAIMNSKVKCENVNYRKARMYIALNLSKTEQMLSPLRRVLPWRTEGVSGVRPGVTANSEK